jgi:hypothetical protein
MKKVLILSTLLVSFGFSAETLKGTPEEKAVMGYCLQCHSYDYIKTNAPLTQKGWEGVVKKMVNVFKAPIPEDAQKQIIEYLTKYYGKKE